MAEHFSIGFVVNSGPRKPVVSECATLRDREEVSAIMSEAVEVSPATLLDRSEVSAVWPREDGSYCVCKDNCNCGGCISPGSICGPRGDDVSVIFSVFDTDGDEFDLTGATEIVFLVADEQLGNIRFVKRLTEGDIQIGGTLYQFMVTITDDDTSSLVRVNNYYEVQVTTSSGLKKTVSAGVFKAPDTMIKDIP